MEQSSLKLACFVALLLLLGACTHPVRGQAQTSIRIPEGSWKCGIEGAVLCSGNATTTSNGILKLTPDPPGRTQNYTHFLSSAGLALHPTPVRLFEEETGRPASLSIEFTLLSETGGSGVAGDGLTFFLLGAKARVGAPGMSLGLYDSNGINRYKTLAVEFDTYRNDPFDVDDHHVGIDTTTVVSEASSTLLFPLLDQRVYAWVDYDPRGSLLEVRASDLPQKPQEALISHTRRLVEVFEGLEEVWVGFSAANGNCVCFSYNSVIDFALDSSFVSVGSNSTRV